MELFQSISRVSGNMVNASSPNADCDSVVVDTPVGHFEYSDMTMVDEKHPVLSRIDGKDVSLYLERYAALHGLDKRARLRTRVTNLSKQGQGWRILTQLGDELYCDKLIVSTGLASEPKYPSIHNINNSFSGPVMHTVSLGLQYHLLTAPHIKEVALVGGNKSAIETLYLCVEAGKVVRWIIRPDGGGASMMVVTNKDKPRIVSSQDHAPCQMISCS